jgi:YidC/Oxa1 family membrane protein insertase
VDLYSFAPIAAVLDGAYQLVSALSHLLAPFGGTSSAALAIVALTMIVRTVLIPVGISQIRAEATRRRLAPKLQQLQRKYRHNRELLQRKTVALYAAEKASPLAGILPTLLQAPVLSVLYGLFILPMVNGHPNGLLTEQLFGVPLGASLVSGVAWPNVLVFIALLLLIAAVAWTSRRVALRLAPAATDAAPPALQNVTRALSWLPFATVAFAAFVPLAATIYLAVTTSWTLAERAMLRRALL